MHNVPFNPCIEKNAAFVDAQGDWMEDFEFVEEESNILGVSSPGGGKI